MKTKRCIPKFFTILILLVMAVCFNSCSDDDDDSPTSKTFLETYAGTTWILNDEGGIPADADVPSYARFINDKTKIFEGWYKLSNEACYYYNNATAFGGTLQIMVNTEAKLNIKIAYGNTESETLTYTVQGDTLTVVYKYEEAGFPAEEFTLYFKKTTVNLDELPLCPA